MSAGGALGSGDMFDRIAGRYDRLNRILSLGLDQRWRRLAREALDLRGGERVLDLATGTADLALQVASGPAQPHVVGADPSLRMLELGVEKTKAARLSERIAFASADAQALPFGGGTFDAACMAFGIRNVADRPRALREIARVVRPGGRVAILELCEPRTGVLGGLGRFYVHGVVPRVGGLLSGEREYRYLQESIARFPSPSEFEGILAGNGLAPVETRPLTLGSCCLFVAVVGKPR